MTYFGDIEYEGNPLKVVYHENSRIGEIVRKLMIRNFKLF